MNKRYLRHLSWKIIFKKRTRTLLSIGATMLSTTIIVTSLFMFFFIYSILQMDSGSYDQYHYLYETTQELSLSTRYHVSAEYQTDIFVDGQVVYHLKLDEKIAPFMVITGQYPINETELLVPSYKAEIGDLIDGYKVVGVYESDLNDKYYTNATGKLCTYYIVDDLVYLSSSKNDLITTYNLNSAQLHINQNRICQVAIQKYLPNGLYILCVYGLVIALCIVASLICIHNIFVISDASRKNEFGLLKSVGCSPKGIRYLILYEMIILGIIGAFFGILLGNFISSYLIKIVGNYLYLDFTFKLLAHIGILFIGGFLGFLILVISGYQTYSIYIHSSVISDLKSNHIDYTSDKTTRKTRNQSFSWRMFLIYNRRMKKQTNNIMLSFILVLCITILFTSVYFVTLIYNNAYTDSKYDMVLTNDGHSDPDFIKAIESLKSDFVIEKLQVLNENKVEWMTLEKSYDEKLLSSLNQVKRDFRLNDNNKQVFYVHLYYYTNYFTQDKIDLLKPFVVEGNLDDLKWSDVVVILNKDDVMGAELCKNFKINDSLYRSANAGILLDEPASMQWDEFRRKMMIDLDIDVNKFNLAAIVHLSDEDHDVFSFPFDEYPRVMMLSYEAAQKNVMRCYDKINIKLENRTDALQLQKSIDELLEIYDVDHHYSYTNHGLIVQDNEHVLFILELALYPMLLLVLIITYLNIYYVLSGNLLLKQHDLQIMKSIGTNTKDLQQMFVYEYLENYINGCAILTALFLPLAIFSSKFEVLDITGNMLGSLIISIFILGPIFLAPMIFIALQKIKSIPSLFKQNII